MTAAGVGGDSPGRGPDAVEMRGVRSKVERRGSQAGFRAPAAGTNAGKASTDWATNRATDSTCPHHHHHTDPDAASKRGAEEGAERRLSRA